MGHSVATVWSHRSVLWVLAYRDLTLKYQQSILGYLWSLIEPLTMAVIYWFIFGLLFNTTLVDGGSYPMFIISGIFAWAWFNSAINESTGALTSQSRLVTTINLPREVFPVGKVLGRFAEFVAGMPILAGAAYLFKAQITWRTFVALPLAVLLQFVLLIGISLLLSAVTVMLRDVERFVRLVVRVLFYASPIIYPLSKVYESTGLPEWAKRIYLSDPMVGIFQLYHAAWFPGEWPSNELLATTVVGTLAVLLLGIWVFRRLEPSVLKEL
ncbi:MAG TPA: ABC transporter [Micromonosporaceae bacterium]|nr:ABC transporter [Micromonosporaceae bacterium]HCU48944.1 ABC transporter [Micromonosporaceae bacterium]